MFNIRLVGARVRAADTEAVVAVLQNKVECQNFRGIDERKIYFFWYTHIQ